MVQRAPDASPSHTPDVPTPPDARGPLPDVRRIAVLRANGIGDAVFALPALDALRTAYPAAEITLLGASWHRAFFAGRPGPVDRVFVVPPCPGVNDLDAPSPGADVAADVERFCARMRGERFDLALQLHGGGHNSNPFVRRLGARTTAGMRALDAPALDRWIPYYYFQYEYARYAEAVARVGAHVTDLEPHLSPTEADLAESRALVPEDDAPLVVLNPGATDPERRWPTDRFAAVARALAADGARIVLSGGQTDLPLAAEIRAAMAMVPGTSEPLIVAGRLALGGTLGLLARAALVISNDSGPLHLAYAVGTRTVGIYWCYNFINAMPLPRTRHRPVVSFRSTCPICGVDRHHGRCDHHPSFVADVPTDEVLGHARALLAEAIATPPTPALTAP